MRKRNDDVSDLSDFAEWAAGMVCSDDFEEYADEFAELACRKLWRLGYIVKDGEDWKRSEEECEDENWYTELDDPKIAERSEDGETKQISAEFAKLMREGEIQVRWREDGET